MLTWNWKDKLDYKRLSRKSKKKILQNSRILPKDGNKLHKCVNGLNKQNKICKTRFKSKLWNSSVRKQMQSTLQNLLSHNHSQKSNRRLSISQLVRGKKQSSRRSLIRLYRRLYSWLNYKYHKCSGLDKMKLQTSSRKRHQPLHNKKLQQEKQRITRMRLNKRVLTIKKTKLTGLVNLNFGITFRSLLEQAETKNRNNRGKISHALFLF